MSEEVFSGRVFDVCLWGGTKHSSRVKCIKICRNLQDIWHVRMLCASHTNGMKDREFAFSLKYIQNKWQVIIVGFIFLCTL